jgi:hypothetical protein
VSNLHSGSARLYGHRLTIRSVWIEGRDLEHALQILMTKGFEPYVLLEAGEEDEFRARFERFAQAGALDWPPYAEYRDLHTVRLYRVADRDRSLAGATIVTDRIPAP